MTVCPACDAYAIGAELESPLPFYSDAIAAFVTVNDWDWWNCDPQNCDIREWPDFGCLTFSESAVHSAVNFVRKTGASLISMASTHPLDAKLVGPTGIPEDTNIATEWAQQLRSLHARMRGEYSSHELDAAIRRLIAAIG